MTPLKLSSVVCKRANILSSTVDEETILLSIENSKYYGMDSIGSTIWQLIEQPVSLEILISMLEEQYDVSYAKCKSDVFTFMVYLMDRNLIKVSDE